MNRLKVVMMLAVLSVASVLVAGQYSEAVLNLSPDAYYRFNNVNAALGDAVVNQGTKGAANNATWGLTGGDPLSLPTAGTASMSPTVHVMDHNGGPLALGMDADNKAPAFMGNGFVYVTDATTTPPTTIRTPGQNNQIGLGKGQAALDVFNAPVMTWSLWFQTPVDYGNDARLMVNVPGGPNQLKLILQSGPNLVISTGTGTYDQGQAALDQNGTWLYGNWHNLVVVKTGPDVRTDIQVYEDGSSLLWGDVFNPSDPGETFSMNDAGTEAVIGARHTTAVTGVSGAWGDFGHATAAGVPDAQVDEVAVWDRALTEADIAAMFAAAINDPKSQNYVNGDTDRNRIIDGVDLATLAQNWDPLGGTQRRWAQGDFNGDGVIDGVDLAALAQGWAPLGIAGGAVPEPATLSLLVLGGLAALRRRK